MGLFQQPANDTPILSSEMELKKEWSSALPKYLDLI
jgi:hypothetical protein